MSVTPRQIWLLWFQLKYLFCHFLLFYLPYYIQLYCDFMNEQNCSSVVIMNRCFLLGQKYDLS